MKQTLWLETFFVVLRRFVRAFGSPPALIAGLGLILSASQSVCLAQGVHHPFAVGADEGAVGDASGIVGWILTQESGFYRLLTGAIRAVREGAAAGWGLAGLSFAYGVFHAAGPGHGKAVVASYMLANETMLRRGLVISLAAALLQGLVAIAIVSAVALIFKASTRHMTEAAHVIEIASYVGISALGGTLLFAKSAALFALLRAAPSRAVLASGNSVAAGGAPSRFLADDCSQNHVHGPACGHFHVPDPKILGSSFSWRGAAVTVAAAGSRPCSGAILVLVFALSQGVFKAGIWSVLAMSLGTAFTTGALAGTAVLAKKAALKYSSGESYGAAIAGHLIEAAAAGAVMLLGLALLAATLAGAGRPV